MKRLLLSALAAATFVAPIATAPASAQTPRYGQQQQYNDHRNDRDWNDNRGRNDRFDRDDRRFDARKHNGYYIGRTWYFGPPPVNAYRMRDYHPGYKAWRKGDRLGYYNTRYVEVDYRRARLKAPPRGYHYVKDDRGDILLAAIAGGLIAAVISASN